MTMTILSNPNRISEMRLISSNCRIHQIIVLETSVSHKKNARPGGTGRGGAGFGGKGVKRGRAGIRKLTFMECWRRAKRSSSTATQSVPDLFQCCEPEM